MSETFEKISAVLDGEVPLAGREVEALAHVQGDHTLQWLSDNWRSIPKGTELADRAHITRLQAEVAALQQRLNVADQRVDELQSELTKARELNEWHINHAGLLIEWAKAWTSAFGPLNEFLRKKINEFHANQSAPAAKDGE